MELNFIAILISITGFIGFIIGYWVADHQAKARMDYDWMKREAHRHEDAVSCLKAKLMELEDSKFKDFILKPVCDKPPKGWRCTRAKGHNGPCAAVPEQETLARIIFAEKFAPDEDKEVITTKWDEWTEDREHSMRIAAAVLRYI